MCCGACVQCSSASHMYNELIVNCLQEQDRIISHKAYASSEDIYRFIDQLGNSNTYPYMV